MKIKTGIDAETRNFCISIESPIFENYADRYEKVLKKSKDCPPGVEVTIENPHLIHVQFPPVPGTVSGNFMDGGRVAVEKEGMVGIKAVMDFTNRFVNLALRDLTKTTEYLPILDFSGGYSFEEMQEDVLSGIRGKRNFLIIDTYEAYKEGTSSGKYEFNQYPIEYGSDEYVEVALLIRNGKLEELRKKYKNKLKKTSWY